MGKDKKLIIGLVGLLLIVAVIAGLSAWHPVIPVLQPKGIIAHKERGLIFFALALSLVVVIPVYAMLFGFAWKYRESNKKAVYRPDWDRSRAAETTWWGVPLLLIAILSVVAWNSSHALDPFKPIESTQQPLTIQVVALQWKWLFIYPQQSIASVNFLQIPTNRPVRFQVTADAPMNSFWVPALGGQIYAMSGMSTEINLEADQPGDFNGVSANISGAGFASMHFITRATSQADFDDWVNIMKQSPNTLSTAQYTQLSQPSTTPKLAAYSSCQAGLYDKIVHQFMPFPSIHDHGGEG